MSLTILFAGATGVAAASLWYHKTPRVTARRHNRATLLDVATAEDAVALLRAMERGDGTEDMADRLSSAYARFPPKEGMLERLSLLQQQLQGEGGVHEYSVTFVYAIAMETVAAHVSKRASRHPLHAPHVVNELQCHRRSRSEPRLVRDKGGRGIASGHISSSQQKIITP